MKESLKKDRSKDYEKMKERRKDPLWAPFFIVRDLKYWDKRRGFVSDLEVDFVKNLIKDGCSYCGETELRVSVDRIDNQKGHTKDNVVACCTICNYIRVSMPYEAWMLLVPAIKKARELGYFKGWLPTVPYLKKAQP